jgi:beta-lactamase class A
MPQLTRRAWLADAAALALLPAWVRGAPFSLREEVTALERSVGGRIGLAALDTGTDWQAAHRADERFALCSTFKLLLAAAILARVDGGTLQAQQPVPYGRAQLLPNSPVTSAHAAAGALPLAGLLQAVIEVSDNTAANCLLALIGGPPGYSAYARTLGDTVTRLDRIEPALNSNLPDDPRDTTTPAAMLADMRRVLTGSALSSASRMRLLGWMKNCRTGQERLRARLPAGWSAGDKTGTGERGAVNDLAILWPPQGRPPLLIACYLSGSARPVDVLAAVHARIGALIGAAL